jgi:hypothetical protein
MVPCREDGGFLNTPGSQGLADLLRTLGFREIRWIDVAFILPHDENPFRLQQDVLRVYGCVLLSALGYPSCPG